MKNYIIILLSVIFLSSCSSQQAITLGIQYAKMYEEKPTSIVVMPPINHTNAVEAKEYFYTTMYMPLCEKGYYVYSPSLTMEMFQSESAYDSEMYLNASLTQFKDILGADAVMFTTIKSWSKSSLIGTITVGIEYHLRSTTTGETLYKREGLITLDKSNSSDNSGGGLLAMAVNMATTALETALTDKIVVARKCTAFVLSDMPAGRYNPLFEKDYTSAAGNKFIKATIR